MPCSLLPPRRRYTWDWADVEAHCDRRDRLLRHRVLCPACDADQVQILTAYVPLAEAIYKCRMCKTRFVQEPE